MLARFPTFTVRPAVWALLLVVLLAMVLPSHNVVNAQRPGGTSAGEPGPTPPPTRPTPDDTPPVSVPPGPTPTARPTPDPPVGPVTPPVVSPTLTLPSVTLIPSVTLPSIVSLTLTPSPTTQPVVRVSLTKTAPLPSQSLPTNTADPVAGAKATEAAAKAEEKEKTKQKAIKISASVAGIVGGGIALAVLGIYIFRKTKLSPSGDFRKRMNGTYNGGSSTLRSQSAQRLNSVSTDGYYAEPMPTRPRYNNDDMRSPSPAFTHYGSEYSTAQPPHAQEYAYYPTIASNATTTYPPAASSAAAPYTPGSEYGGYAPSEYAAYPPPPPVPPQSDYGARSDYGGSTAGHYDRQNYNPQRPYGGY
ncbi:hypothetical protein DFJ77DRAFT_448177 [Powellomyces hirtus]|nr:hypothetical protein DFJ77DRAFT_448177 [Powellomyces hirtus]